MKKTHLEKIIEISSLTRSEKSNHVGQRLKKLRELEGMTQNQVAERMGTEQPAISRLEGSKDILLSTLRSYVTAIGAKLRVDASLNKNSSIVKKIVEKDIHFSPFDEDQILLPIFNDDILFAGRDVVFSIRPIYSQKIFTGEKRVELRRRFPVQIPEGTSAIIYSTSPVRAITGVADIVKVSKASPSEIWSKYHKEACINKDAFDSYFDKLDLGCAIELANPRELKREIGLEELRDRFNFEPPQSFLYTDPSFKEILSGSEDKVLN